MMEYLVTKLPRTGLLFLFCTSTVSRSLRAWFMPVSPVHQYNESIFKSSCNNRENRVTESRVTENE